MSEASPLEPEAPVTGQARMDAAWGAHSGDETAADVAMASTAQSGQIFEQHYTPWRGTLNPRWMRNWSILRHHLLGIFKKATVLGRCRQGFSFSSPFSLRCPMPG